MGNYSGNGSVGCCIMNSLAEIFGNLFSTEPYCGCGCHHPQGNFNSGFVSGVNVVSAANGLGNGGCGCGNNFANGLSSGINAANALVNAGGNNGNHGGGCGCGCGSNADLSSYTACNNQCYDAYYAQQYGLYPFDGSGCGCGGQGF